VKTIARWSADDAAPAVNEIAVAATAAAAAAIRALHVESCIIVNK